MTTLASANPDTILTVIFDMLFDPASVLDSFDPDLTGRHAVTISDLIARPR